MQWLRQLPYELLLGWRYTRAGRSSRRNGFISFISGVSMLGITLGVATLIIVLSVINGFQKEVRDRMLGVLAHAEVYASDGQPLPDAQALMARVRQVPDVRGVAPFVAMQALMTRGEDMRGVMLRGVDPALEPSVSDIFKGPQGAALARLQPGEFGVLLGVDLARNLNVQLADTVTLMTPNGQMTPAGAVPRIKQLRVVGFFNSGHYEFDANMALVHIDDAVRLARQEGPSGLRLHLKDMHQAPAVALDLNMALGAEYFVRDWTRSNRTWFAAVQVEKRMLFIILTLIVAVAAFNLVSTLVMTVTEKRADIAILRTLGASPRSIMGIFVVQGAAVGFMGTFIGLGLGLLVAFNIDVIVPAIEQLLGVSFLPKEIYLINAMPSDPQAADIVPITLFSLLMAFVATLYPSWQASRLNPAEALRYE